MLTMSDPYLCTSKENRVTSQVFSEFQGGLERNLTLPILTRYDRRCIELKCGDRWIFKYIIAL